VNHQPDQSDPGPGRYLDLPVGQFLAAVSAPTPDPGGGAVAALAVTLAASLCAMTASLSTRQLTGPGPDAASLARRASELRDQAAPLAQEDADGYRAVLAARRAGDGPATLLAAAGAQSAAVLVQINLAGAAGDSRPGHAAGLAAEATRLAGTARL